MVYSYFQYSFYINCSDVLCISFKTDISFENIYNGYFLIMEIYLINLYFTENLKIQGIIKNISYFNKVRYKLKLGKILQEVCLLNIRALCNCFVAIKMYIIQCVFHLMTDGRSAMVVTCSVLVFAVNCRFYINLILFIGFSPLPNCRHKMHL